MDAEFEKLLRQGYGLRDNHIRIMDFLAGREASAEAIWRGTKVPRGRIYEFLGGLERWGFIEVAGGKPRRFKLRNPRRAMEMAIGRKEKEITQIQRRSLEIARNLEWVESVEGLKIQVIQNSQEYYSRLREMVFSGNRFRTMVKKPLIFLASARQTAWKRRFYEALVERGKGDLKVEYLFPLDNLLGILERENRDLVLNELEEVLEYIDLKYVPTGGNSMALAGNRVLFGFTDPVERQVERSVYIESKEMGKGFQEVFDSVFGRAQKVDSDLIQRLSMDEG